MGFFNSLPIRISLAIIGGILYGLLTYCIVSILGLPFELVVVCAILVFLFYFGSRLFLLFSGINSPYYSRGNHLRIIEEGPLYLTVQWIGKFYHYHDIGLFVFLTILAITFIISLIIDLFLNIPLCSTIQKIFPFQI